MTVKKENKNKQGNGFTLPADDRSEMHRIQSVKNARQVIRKYVKKGISLVDELIQSRREESAR
jgi:hypothetical protein